MAACYCTALGTTASRLAGVAIGPLGRELPKIQGYSEAGYWFGQGLEWFTTTRESEARRS